MNDMANKEIWKMLKPKQFKNYIFLNMEDDE